MESTLEKSLYMLTEAQRIAQIGCWELDLSNYKLVWSKEIFRIFEIDPERFGASYEAFLQAVHPEDREAVNGAYTESLQNRQPYEIEHRLLMPDGRIKYVLERGRTDYDAEGRPVRSLGTVQNITDRRLLEIRLAEREQEFRTLADNSPDTIARYDQTCRRVYVNVSYAKLAGKSAEALLGVTPTQYGNAAQEMEAYEAELRAVLESGVESEYEMTRDFRDGKTTSLIRMVPERDRDGNVVGVLAVGRDITEIDEYRRKIHRLAFFDELTGLPNRTLFGERLRQTLAGAARHGYLTGMMLLDLDCFKVVNDTLGHPAGDSLLQEVASRMSSTVRDYDTVARFGGDEFALLLPEIRHEYDVAGIVKKIQNAFVEPFRVIGRELFLTPSMGIALCPKDGGDGDELFRCADSALYHAKLLGRNCFRMYSADLTVQAKERLDIEAALRTSVANGELEIFYQPQIDLGKGRLLGAEALLRWHHPERGLLTPDKFIGIAEDTGLIVGIGEWVLREACNTVVKWNKGGNGLYRIAVNVSTRQFRMNDLAASLRAILEETGCRPEWLELEITESLLLEDNDEIRKALDELSDIGVSLAIDDFGTGYSALGYLNRFPIHILKIDRSFINGIAGDAHNAALVKAIIAMAYSLKLRLVAEGVETAQQDEMLRAWGCHTAQGYLYGRPTPLADFEHMLSAVDGRRGLRHEMF